MSFLVTGLPRSRTAWWAVVMDAVHEPSARTASLAAWSCYLSLGVSDSGIGLRIEEIMHEYAPRTLIVERPLGEVWASAERLFGPLPITGLAKLSRLSEALKFTHPLIRRISFADMRDSQKLHDAAEWLVKGFGNRAVAMKDFNIQVTRDHALALARQDHSGWMLEPV